jgi:hypothetical protein
MSSYIPECDDADLHERSSFGPKLRDLVDGLRMMDGISLQTVLDLEKSFQ